MRTLAGASSGAVSTPGRNSGGCFKSIDKAMRCQFPGIAKSVSRGNEIRALIVAMHLIAAIRNENSGSHTTKNVSRRRKAGNRAYNRWKNESSLINRGNQESNMLKAFAVEASVRRRSNGARSAPTIM